MIFKSSVATGNPKSVKLEMKLNFFIKEHKRNKKKIIENRVFDFLKNIYFFDCKPLYITFFPTSNVI